MYIYTFYTLKQALAYASKNRLKVFGEDKEGGKKQYRVCSYAQMYVYCCTRSTPCVYECLDSGPKYIYLDVEVGNMSREASEIVLAGLQREYTAQDLELLHGMEFTDDDCRYVVGIIYEKLIIFLKKFFDNKLEDVRVKVLKACRVNKMSFHFVSNVKLDSHETSMAFVVWEFNERMNK